MFYAILHRAVRIAIQALTVGIAAVAVTGCVTPVEGDPLENRKTRAEHASDGAGVAVQQTRRGMGAAVMAPAEDFNLKREQIPPLLLALNSPYDPVPRRSCAGLTLQIAELDAVLGPDVDQDTPRESAARKAGEVMAGATLSTVSDVTTGVIPFRSLVRRATGATKWERKVRAAYERGTARRAYLKGIGREHGCKPPAAPMPRRS